MLKLILLVVALASGLAQAQVRVVELHTEHLYASTNGEIEMIFPTKACDIKALAIVFEGKHVTYLRTSKLEASYQTENAWGVDRDTYQSYDMLMAGEATPWRLLRPESPCLRRIYLTGEAVLWPGTEARIIVYGLK